MNSILRRIYPEEILVAIALAVIGVVFALSPQTLRWYDSALGFIMYFNLVIPAFVYSIAVFLYQVIRFPHTSKKISTLLWKSFGHGLRVWIVFYAALVITFNVKMNVGIWRDVLYDPSLYRIDQWLAQWFSWFSQWHLWLDGIYDVSSLYTLLYQGLFLASFIIMTFISQRAFRELFSATIIALLIGNVVYVLLPALGPFLFSDPHSPFMQEVFQGMYMKYYIYVSSDGLSYVPTFLVQGLAAMPSLHIANTIVFVYFIWRYARYALIVYIPLTLFIAVEAVYTRFHYVLDLIIGIELACIAIMLARLIYAYCDRRYIQTSPSALH